jgi:hypothetical protein
MLHILNGAATQSTLEHADVPGRLVVWTDVLHEGPVPLDRDMDAWIRARSRYLASCGWSTEDAVLTTYLAAQAAIDAWSDHEEVVLWFEHDLYDQLLLIRHLAWWQRVERGTVRLSLICIGEFPGIADFVGLGQLTPAQIAGLLPGRNPVTDAQFALGLSAWKAFTSRDPLDLETIVGRDTAALSYLDGALHRVLEEYPARENGLSRTERQILELLVAGPLSPDSLFRANQRKEERVFMGDATFWLRVQALAAGAHPLVEIATRQPAGEADGPAGVFRTGEGRAGEVRITDTGRAVLIGRADWIERNGIDRWIGGVHLHGTVSPWRWDREARRLVRPEH